METVNFFQDNSRLALSARQNKQTLIFKPKTHSRASFDSSSDQGGRREQDVFPELRRQGLPREDGGFQRLGK